jgi:hypothetical protein
MTMIFHYAPRMFLVCSLHLRVSEAMTDNQTEEANRKPEKAFAGFSEIDQAIRENRLMEYRIKKAWADPWSRTLSITVIFILVLFAGFVIYWDFLRA